MSDGDEQYPERERRAQSASAPHGVDPVADARGTDPTRRIAPGADACGTDRPGADARGADPDPGRIVEEATP